MTLPLRSLRTLLPALFVGLVMLCVVAQPVVATLQEAHELEHQRADGSMPHAADEAAGDDESPLEKALHAFDCCVHSPVVGVDAFAWMPMLRRTPPPAAAAGTFAPMARAEFLRPPIAA